jgi:hypothetical protein
MAEAESFRKQTYSLTSSSGIFHFLTGNGGAQQSRRKEDLGQYDAKGVLRTSSLKQQRLRAMMGNPKYSDSIKKQPGLVRAFYCTSGTHRTICPHKAGYPGIRQPEDAVQRFL